MDLLKEKLRLEIELKKSPFDEDIICLYACVLIENDEFEVAIELLKTKIKNKTSLKLLNNIAYIYMCEGYLSDGVWSDGENEAIKILEKVKLTNPKSSFPHSMLGELYLKKNKYEEAIRALKIAININETVANYNNLGVALFKQEKYEQASVHFFKSHLLRISEDYSFKPYLNYGICMALLGKKMKRKVLLII